MLAALARTLLRAFGWTVDFEGMPGPRGVLIVYPHTSNWDFILGLLAKWSLGLPLRWIGKESLFSGLTGATLGRLMRFWGGRPVDRHHASGAVAQLTALMRSEAWFWLALSPEGTRQRRDHLRSGFYHLALAADVPVGLGYIDYPRKRIGVLEFKRMSGDIMRDLESLRAYYADKHGRYPALESDFRFRQGE